MQRTEGQQARDMQAIAQAAARLAVDMLECENETAQANARMYAEWAERMREFAWDTAAWPAADMETETLEAAEAAGEAARIALEAANAHPGAANQPTDAEFEAMKAKASEAAPARASDLERAEWAPGEATDEDEDIEAILEEAEARAMVAINAIKNPIRGFEAREMLERIEGHDPDQIEAAVAYIEELAAIDKADHA